MARKQRGEEIAEEIVEAVEPDPPPPREAVYTAEELAAAAGGRFGTRPECVRAAFLLAKRTEATLGEARTMVKDYLNRSVK